MNPLSSPIKYKPYGSVTLPWVAVSKRVVIKVQKWDLSTFLKPVSCTLLIFIGPVRLWSHTTLGFLENLGLAICLPLSNLWPQMSMEITVDLYLPLRGHI